MNKITDNSLSIVDKSSWHIYDFAATQEDAENTLIKACEQAQEDIILYNKYITDYPQNKEYWTDRLNETKNKQYSIMKYGEFIKKERDYYLSKPLKNITEKAYWDALECLPPLKWCTINGVEMFLMSEFYTGCYTSQYAKKDGKYYSKLVDAYDKTTWIYNIAL